MKQRNLIAPFAATALAAFSAPALAGEPCEGNLVDVAVENEFDILVAAVQAAGLVEALQGPGPLTVFAPTDEAFEALPEAVVNVLFDNPQILRQVLLHHVVPGEVLEAQAVTLDTALSLAGQRLDVTANDDGLFIDESEVVLPDVLACNGVVHVINKVLVPDLSQAPGLARALGVLDVVDALVVANFATGEFSALLGAVGDADLAMALKDLDEVTLFAPTDAAFADLPRDLVNMLENDINLLVDVLLYHAVPETLFAVDVINHPGATTLLQEDLSFSFDGANVFINTSQVVLANRRVANGVVHVIDAVLLPPR